MMAHTMHPAFASQAAEYPRSNFQIIDPKKPVIQHMRSIKPDVLSATHSRVIDAWDDREVQPDHANLPTLEDVPADYFPGSLMARPEVNLLAATDMATALVAQNWGVKNLQPLHDWWFQGLGVGNGVLQHCDFADGLVAAEPEERLFVAMLFITGKGKNAWNFGGGVIEFPGLIDTYGAPYRVAPAAGSLLVFPASAAFSYKIEEVTRGHQLALMNFFGVSLTRS